MYANLLGYSDVTPFEVVRTASATKLFVREMSAVPAEPAQPLRWVAGGFAGHCVNQTAQRWTITPDASAHTFAIRLHKNGQWRDAGRRRYSLSDTPRRFYDMNF